MDKTQPWIETPLLLSRQLSRRLGCRVYLKLEGLQPSQSFKYRGISFLARHCLERYGKTTHLIIASGGNAGLACACAARDLNIRCTVYIPEGNSATIIERLEEEGAQVIVAGSNFHEADQRAREDAATSPQSVYIHPYDDPLLWEGHSSLLEEIRQQLHDRKPDAIFCSVGGGGLLGGLLVGTGRIHWDTVPIFTVETTGSSCFHQTMLLNQSTTYHRKGDAQITLCGKIKLASIVPRSKATCLGASSPAPSIVSMSLERVRQVQTLTVPDEASMEATLRFAEDHKMLLELACSTTLVPVYNPTLFRQLLPDASADSTVVFVVCGGTKISLEEIRQYSDELSTYADDYWVAEYGSESMRVERSKEPLPRC